MKKVKDGWHKVYGYQVWVEDGYAIRGISSDGHRPYAIYSADRNGELDRREGVRLDTLRRCMARGTMVLR